MEMLRRNYHTNHASTGTMDRYFYHPDHIGSSSWITDGSGQAIQHLHYLPFGEDWVDQRNTSWNAPYTFSGKEKDAETGYGYFGARYYDSGLSIWLSVDPMSDKYPSLSPYNYCANNPVMFVDPDGRDLELGGNIAQATSDIKSIVNSSNSDRITVDPNTGVVQVNRDGLTQEDIKNDIGLSLIIDLVDADQKYLYEASDNTSASFLSSKWENGGFVPIYVHNSNIDLLRENDNGVMNASVYGKDSQDAYNYLPKDGYHGQVTIATSCRFEAEWLGYTFENRKSLIFHELKESYYRTTKRYDYNPNRTNRNWGAHARAASDESYNFNNEKAGEINLIK